MAPQREWFEKDYYKTLGVASTATPKEITSAYRKLAKKHHPDTNPGDDELFKEISAAYDVLGDAEKRKEYDEVRTLGPAAGGFPGGFGGGGGFPGGGTFRVEDIRRLRATCSAGCSAGAGAARSTAGPQRGADVETELHLTFEDAVSGVTTSVNVTTDARCHTCSGSGSAPGTRPDTCPRCGGTGLLQDNQGLFSLSQICPQCSGRGTIVDPPVPDVLGTGVEHRNRSVKVRHPRRRRGRPADPGQGPRGGRAAARPRRRPLRGGPGGRHSLFGRRGRNLTLTVPVGFPEAALGTT